jgi:hypothetical protein
MTDRKRTIVLGGLLALVSACKGEAPEGTSPEVKPTGPEGAGAKGAEAKGTDAKAIEPAKAEPPQAEPPPSGHAVAKVGSLLFFSSTGDVGFELPPVGTSAGMTVNVVGEQDGRLVVETLVTEPAEHHCTATLDGLADFRLRLYLAEAELLPVLTEELEHAFADGTKIRLARGVPVPPTSTEIVARGTAVRVPVPAERLGRFYPPGPPFASEGGDGKLHALEGEALTYDGRALDEANLYREGGEVIRFGATERTGDALVTVRNPCLEATGLVSLARLGAGSAMTPPGGAIAVLKARESGAGEGGMFAMVDSDEDVWGGLTGTEVGEAYGVGGLGLVGTGPTEKAWEVKAGVAITWADGRPAGQVTADHRFKAAPRDQGGRSCFDAPLVEGQVTTVTLCFAPGDVGEVEAPAGVGGLGGTGFGLGTGTGTGTGTIGLGSAGPASASTGSGLGARGKRIPTVRQSKAEVKGSLDKDIIRRIVRAHINEVRYCYNQGLVKDPSLSGKVSIQFSIAPSGSVSEAKVTDSTLEDGAVANCIAKAVKRWSFPKPVGGGAVIVTYPFVLEPG